MLGLPFGPLRRLSALSLKSNSDWLHLKSWSKQHKGQEEKWISNLIRLIKPGIEINLRIWTMDWKSSFWVKQKFWEFFVKWQREIERISRCHLTRKIKEFIMERLHMRALKLRIAYCVLFPIKKRHSYLSITFTLS